MNRILFLTSLLAIILLTSCGDSEPTLITFDQVLKVGDSAEWAQLDYDDSSWAERIYDLPDDSVFWVRFTEEVPQIKDQKSLGLRITATGAYEVYWDGIYLGRNGILALNNQKEGAGNYVHNVLLPDSLAYVGKHVLALRCTKQYKDIGQHAFFLLDDYYFLVTGPIHVSKYMFFIGGVFFIAAIYFLLIYISNIEDYSFLIFSIICFVFLAILLLEYYKLFAFYEYTFQRKRLTIIGWLHVVLTILIPIFFAIEFKFPWKKYLLGLIVLCVVVIEFVFDAGFDYSAMYQNQIMWILSLSVVLYAAYQKQKEAFWVLVGFAGSALVFYIIPFLHINFVSIYDVALFVSFVCIILSMFYILSHRRKEQRLAYQESLLISERLKNELLKKNIKPHFIMNTLTSLIDWVEDSPKEGVKFIHALADEFDILNEVADYKLVPIEQEIKLCQNHLKVMQFRKEINYKWIQNGIDHNEIIPPAILHTVIENGVTHSKPNEDGEIVFVVSYTKGKAFKKYEVLVKAKIDESVVLKDNKTIGTGTKYIKSRLQESYGKNWRYSSEQTDEGWLTTIEFLNKN